MALLSDVIRSGIRAEDLTDLPPEIRKGIEPLLKFVNTGIQGLASAFGRNITLTDNVRSEVKTVNLDHGVAQLIYLKKIPQAKGVRSISVGSADGITQHMLSRPPQLIGTTTPGQVKVLAYFADSTAIRVPVTLELTPEGNYTSLTPSDGTWIAPTLLNSWANSGGGYDTAAYFKDPLGFIRIRGTVVNAPGAVAGAPIFTLPAGYRPTASRAFSVVDATTLAGSFERVDVDSAGNVFPQAAVGLGATLCLDGIQFDTRP